MRASLEVNCQSIDSRTGLVSPILISLNLSLESFFIWYPLIQTLPHQHAQFYFCLIEPTPMLGRVVEFQLLQYPSGFGWLKGLIQRCFGMCVEVVHHYTDQFSIRVATIYQPLHLMCKVILCPMLGHLNVTPARLRLTEYEKIACAVALVLIIKALDLPGCWRQSLSNLLNQLLACFIKIYFRSLRAIRLFIEIKHLFHSRNKLGTHLWYTPLLLLPRLKLVFFSTRRTDSRENDSANPNSTTLPASNRNVQCVWPCGALLQAKAMIWPCCLPVSFGRAPGLGRSFSASSPPSTNLLRVRSMVAVPTSSTAAIWSSVRPSAALSKIRALVTLRAEGLPRRTSWSSCSRSSVLKSKMYFLAGNWDTSIEMLSPNSASFNIIHQI